MYKLHTRLALSTLLSILNNINSPPFFHSPLTLSFPPSLSLHLVYSVNICFVGVLEKAVFFAEYESLNVTGVSGNLLSEVVNFLLITLGTIIQIVYC